MIPPTCSINLVNIFHQNHFIADNMRRNFFYPKIMIRDDFGYFSTMVINWMGTSEECNLFLRNITSALSFQKVESHLLKKGIINCLWKSGHTEHLKDFFKFLPMLIPDPFDEGMKLAKKNYCKV